MRKDIQQNLDVAIGMMLCKRLVENSIDIFVLLPFAKYNYDYLKSCLDSFEQGENPFVVREVHGDVHYVGLVNPEQAWEELGGYITEEHWNIFEQLIYELFTSECTSSPCENSILTPMEMFIRNQWEDENTTSFRSFKYSYRLRDYIIENLIYIKHDNTQAEKWARIDNIIQNIMNQYETCPPGEMIRGYIMAFAVISPQTTEEYVIKDMLRSA